MILFIVPWFGTSGPYLCINKTDKPLNFIDMNTANTISFISSMVSSEASYNILMDMINEMDLEVMDVCMA